MAQIPEFVRPCSTVLVCPGSLKFKTLPSRFAQQQQQLNASTRQRCSTSAARLQPMHRW